MLKRLLSYLIPLNVAQRKSGWSKNLEVNWNNGQLVLDSKNTNYSYGSLQRILRKGLKTIGFENVRPMQDILVLGVAGGSVIKTLVDEIGCRGRITGVEIDADVLELAQAYFGLQQIPNLELVVDDAFEFCLRTRKQYDLIIIDIFQDTHMPNFLFEQFFANRTGALMKPGGWLMFNTMLLEAAHEDRNKQYRSFWEAPSFTLRVLPRVEQHNEILIVYKNA